MVKDVGSHFRALAARWDALGLPLRPLAPVPGQLKTLIPPETTRMLILGVTPDFADLAADVTALDNAEAMIAAVWPGDSPDRRAVLGDWSDMPFDDASFDLVVGDGSLTLLPFPDGVDHVLSEVRRVTKPGGQAIFRIFIAPDAPLSDDDLISYARSLKGHSIDALRWRFAVQAVHGAPTPNIVSDDAWRAFVRLFPDPAPLMAENGWTDEDFQRVALYRDGKMQLNFPTRAQIETAAGRHFGDIAFQPSGDYPMSELCPFLVLRGDAIR